MGIDMDGKTPEQAALEIAFSIRMPKKTRKNIEELLIPKIEKLSPRQIAMLRKKQEISQAVMAAYLGVNEKTVQSWEQGQRSPSKSSLRLLQLMQSHGLEIFQQVD